MIGDKLSSRVLSFTSMLGVGDHSSNINWCLLTIVTKLGGSKTLAQHLSHPLVFGLCSPLQLPTLHSILPGFPLLPDLVHSPATLMSCNPKTSFNTCCTLSVCRGCAICFDSCNFQLLDRILCTSNLILARSPRLRAQQYVYYCECHFPT